MSFNVRTLNQNRVLEKFKTSGINGVIDLFNSPDALILQDEITAYIYQEIVLDKDPKEKETEILKYINKIKI
jgi:hypothetical protein